MDLEEIKKGIAESTFSDDERVVALVAEVERLTQLTTEIMAERKEMHDRLLSRAGEAEGRVLRLKEEMEWLKAALSMDKTAQQALLVGDEIAQLQSSLTRSKAEGRIEGMEEAKRLCDAETLAAKHYRIMAGCINCSTAIAAATHQQSVQERGPE